MCLPLEFNGLTDRRARLLVVEDDLTSVFALRHYFAFAGYDVDCAAGPSEGLRLLDRNDYDAVITDLHLLPGRHSDGMRVAAHARERNPRACVVMLTAHGSDLTETEARRCGVDIYRTKPVDLDGLIAGIATVLNGRARRPIAETGGALPAVGGESA